MLSALPRRCHLILALAALLLAAPVLDGRCGVQRWDVKTGKDAAASAIDLSSPTPTTIAFLTDLTRFPPPAHWPPPSRIAPVETTFWTLDATLDSFKFENDPQTGDSDYHLFIKDDAGNTVVAEIPFPPPGASEQDLGATGATPPAGGAKPLGRPASAKTFLVRREAVIEKRPAVIAVGSPLSAGREKSVTRPAGVHLRPSLLDLRRPVQHERDRVGLEFPDHGVGQESLPVGGDVVTQAKGGL